MINIFNAQEYCRDDISLIENYDLAIDDGTQTWEIHHRNEILENKTAEELDAENRYYKVPASDLILLTKSEHMSLHASLRNIGNKYRLGTHHSTETKKKIGVAKKGNKNWLGKHRSEETKQKLSDKLKGKPNLKNSKKVCQYTKNGEFVAEYPSATEAARKTGICHIGDCCNGHRKYAGGYIWKFA